MKFNTLREYFYKLHNLLYMALLPPLLLFAYFYLEFQATLLTESTFSLMVVLVSCGYLFILLYGLYHTRKGVTTIRKEPSLRRMLETYADLLKVRFFSVGGASLLLLVGFVVVHDPLFVALFVVSLIVFSVFWPTSRRVANDLKLKGDARAMVIRKSESLPGPEK